MYEAHQGAHSEVTGRERMQGPWVLLLSGPSVSGDGLRFCSSLLVNLKHKGEFKVQEGKKQVAQMVSYGNQLRFLKQERRQPDFILCSWQCVYSR